MLTNSFEASTKGGNSLKLGSVMDDLIRTCHLEDENIKSETFVMADQRSPDDHFHIVNRIYLCVCVEHLVVSTDLEFTYFTFDGIQNYIGFCDDFGPMSLESVYHFCGVLERQVRDNPDKSVALTTKNDRRSITNAVFLIGSYMLMKLGSSPDEVERCVSSLRKILVPYRDVSPGEQNFALHLHDCWAGLWRAKRLGWVSFEPQSFDVAEYAHYDNPFNADLHEIVPGKFVAMRGPKQLPSGQLWEDVYTREGKFSHREFSPAHYVDTLHNFNVQAVVRLNKPEYSKDEFNRRGLGVVDLYFEDCTTPSADVVAKFMMIAEGLPGALAVHCKAGLGRTGTMIGLYMMAHCGFAAREAIGWMRIVRPGSVIGIQQQYLCEKEAVMRRTGFQFLRDGPACSLYGTGLPAVERLIAAATELVDRRLDAIKPKQRRPIVGPVMQTVVPVAAAQAAVSTPRLELHEMPAAECWSSEVARVTLPSLDRRKTVSSIARLSQHVAASSARRSMARAKSLGGPDLCVRPRVHRLAPLLTEY